MEFVALDGTKLLALMVAGGIFSIAGLWLMFRPSAGAEAARIELFGMKFESSSAGILVFLTGAVFLAAPIFVEPAVSSSEPPEVNHATSRGDRKSPSSNDGLTAGPPVSEGSEPTVDIALRQQPSIIVEGKEVEPNDTIAAANVIPLGAAVIGTTGGNPDFFRLDAPKNASEGVSITVSGFAMEIAVFDQYGEMIFKEFGSDGAATFRGPASAAPFFVRVTSGAPGFSYQLTTAARPVE